MTPISSPSFSHKVPLSERLEKGIASMFLLIGILCLCLSSFYLFQRNKNSTLGYRLRILQEERADLLSKNEALSMKISDLGTIERLQKESGETGMVSAAKGNIFFLKGQNAVAQEDKGELSGKKVF